MRIKKGKLTYDVARDDCGERECFWPGQDKGTYVQGRGYVSYHKKPILVCMRRHLHGCPENSVCGKCRVVSVLSVGGACDRVGCDGLLVALESEEEQR